MRASYDVVSGGYGNDRFEVDSERSDYYGDAGNDVFLSVGFDNYFNGGSGTDTISYELQDEYSLAARQGCDDRSRRPVGIDHDRPLRGPDQHRECHRQRTTAMTTSPARSGRNILKGLGGNDMIEGLGGGDDLYGGSGDDDLYGGSGDDDLIGGSALTFWSAAPAVDYLNGGTGADIFDFNSISDIAVGSRRDVIADFHRSELDVVDLATIDAN